jgi:hypothetical protein
MKLLSSAVLLATLVVPSIANARVSAASPALPFPPAQIAASPALPFPPAQIAASPALPFPPAQIAASPALPFPPSISLL